MALRLDCMRHGKSSWSNLHLGDHDRALKKRGRRQADEVAKMLAGRGELPERVLCSTATRAQQTFERIKTCWGTNWDGDFIADRRLYFEGLDGLLDAIRDHHGDCRNLMVLGHSPVWEELVAYLTGMQPILKTSDCAVLQTDLDSWAEALAPERWGCIEILSAPR
ncbi:MAG: histidine phosphatase family protein [Myxococcota bacterium]|nr:histidine phosphatase family protein [Myxococcota bacterium]